jgi:hypothetical protein
VRRKATLIIFLLFCFEEPSAYDERDLYEAAKDGFGEKEHSSIARHHAERLGAVLFG